MLGQETAAFGQDCLDPGGQVRPMLQRFNQLPDILDEGIVPPEMTVQFQREDLGVGQSIALVLSHGG